MTRHHPQTQSNRKGHLIRGFTNTNRAKLKQPSVCMKELLFDFPVIVTTAAITATTADWPRPSSSSTDMATRTGSTTPVKGRSIHHTLLYPSKRSFVKDGSAPELPLIELHIARYPCSEAAILILWLLSPRFLLRVSQCN